ncbi:GNAT family N-acetyltransferase [Microbacter sp. GSS18]|nr:GNAT family N-acetyltransferase [Microbacter sp. GSS18]
MSDSPPRGTDRISILRAFNRTVTERIGVLEDHYLDRGRSLALDRLLWEIGRDGADVRELRARLDLDSGYLSRLLRSLETEGLVETVASGDDSRVRRAVPTPAGRAEIDVLDDRSDELADAILSPLTESQQQELVDAASTVQRLFTASAVEVGEADPDSVEGRFAIGEYFAVLAERFDVTFDPAVTRPTPGDSMRPPAGRFLLATLKGVPVGCVGVKLHHDGVGEIKRLWVARQVRGTGLGRRLLNAIEDVARDAEATVVRLDTNRNLTEAIRLYRTAGYTEIPAFNDEPYAHHWFEKHLTHGRAGFLGLGLMGSIMARRLVGAGVPLTVWNRSDAALRDLESAGAVAAPTPADVFAASDTVIMMLRNEQAIDAVIRDDTGAIGSFVAGRTLVNMGTIAPEASRRLDEDIRAAGGTYVEAPVSGSRVPAQNGELLAMIAGPEDAVSRVRPLMTPLCAQVTPCGEVPGALTMKLSVNVFLVSLLTGLAESFHFGREHGVDLAVLRQILDAGQMSSPISRVKTDKLVRADMSAQASVADGAANAGLILGAARAAGIATPVIDVCAQLFADGVARGDGHLDAIAVIETMSDLNAQA